jgi:acyl-CoA thioesterase-1
MKTRERPFHGVGQWLAGCCFLLMATLAQAQAQPARSPEPAMAPTRTVLVMGDSLSAAYGMPAARGWVALTAERIAREHPGWQVVNASISGETSAGGASRVIGELLRHRPAVVVIELGANDALRGLPLRQLRRNLGYMIGAARHIGAEVLLVGMRMPPNLGVEYTQGFERGYRQLAELFDIELLPFLLQPVASERDAFQADNLHPTAGAQPRIRDHVWSELEPLLQ